MRKDVLAVLKQYKHEIVEFYDNEPYINDWWHYLDDVAINAHDYEETGKIHINLYTWFDDVGVVDMIKTDTLTIEELTNL